MKEIADQRLQERRMELGQHANSEFVLRSAEELRGLLDEFVARRGQIRRVEDFETLVRSFTTLVRCGRELYGFDQQTSRPNTLVEISVSGTVEAPVGRVVPCELIDV